MANTSAAPRRDIFRFDTLNKKPTVWNIAVFSGIAAVIFVIMLIIKPLPVTGMRILICTYLVLVIAALLRAFFLQLRYNPYSYNTLYYAAFSLFVLSALVAQGLVIYSVIHSDADSASNLMSQFGNLVSSAYFFMLVSAPFIFVFSAGLCISNLSLIRHEGKRLVNLLGILLSVLMIGGEVFLFASSMYASGSVMEVMVHDLVVNLFAALYLYFECMVIGTILANIIVTRHTPAYDKDYLIILGCGIRKDGTPTPLLRGRCDRAIRFYREQLAQTGKAPVLVTSGGQGPNEIISESACMKAYLLENGIPEDHILEENRSVSTFENMKFSKKIILQDLIRKNPAATQDTLLEDLRWGRVKTAFSTTNYHIFRSGLMARRVKMRAIGIGASTKWYFWPNATVREFVGILTEHRLKQGLILGGMILLYSATTVIYYLLL